MVLEITDDFDLDRIADSGQCFRWKKDESGAIEGSGEKEQES